MRAEDKSTALFSTKESDKDDVLRQEGEQSVSHQPPPSNPTVQPQKGHRRMRNEGSTDLCFLKLALPVPQMDAERGKPALTLRQSKCTAPGTSPLP